MPSANENRPRDDFLQENRQYVRENFSTLEKRSRSEDKRVENRGCQNTNSEATDIERLEFTSNANMKYMQS